MKKILKKIDTLFKAALPPNLYKLLLLKFSLPKALKALLIPGYFHTINLFGINPAQYSGIYKTPKDIPNQGNGWVENDWIQSREKNLQKLSAAQSGLIPKTEHINSFFCLLINQLLTKGKCRILDFGGGTGETWYKIAPALTHADQVEYHVCDFPESTELGKRYAPSQLFFTNDIPQEPHDIVYINGVLQYIEEYEDILSRLAQLTPQYFVFLRLNVWDGEAFLTAQSIHGTYNPVWFLNANKFISFMNNLGYDLMLKTSCSPLRINNHNDVAGILGIPHDAAMVFIRQKQ